MMGTRWIALGIALGSACGGDDGGATPVLDESEGGAATSSGSGSEATGTTTGAADTTEGDSSSTGDPAAQDPAVAAFWAAFLAEDYDALPQIIADLDAAAAGQPDDPEVVLIAAHAHLWRLGEFQRDPDQDPVNQIVSAMAAIEGFTAAKALAPDDFRIPCWLGLVQINTGTAIGDETLVAMGQAEVDAAIAGWPEFALFCRMLANEGAPADSPEFAQAVDDVWTTLDLCFGDTVGPTAPELAGSLDQQTAEGPLRVCWNLAPKAVHNWQGFLLHAGDIVAKSGDVEAATVLYEDAMLLDWDSWSHQALVDDRLADVAARADSYADDDPSNDAELGSRVYSCTMCHGS